MSLAPYLFSGEIVECDDRNCVQYKFYGITFAHSYVEALQKILDDYNEEDIVNLTIIPFEEGCTLSIDESAFERIMKYGY